MAIPRLYMITEKVSSQLILNVLDLIVYFVWILRLS